MSDQIPGWDFMMQFGALQVQLGYLLGLFERRHMKCWKCQKEPGNDIEYVSGYRAVICHACHNKIFAMAHDHSSELYELLFARAKAKAQYEACVNLGKGGTASDWIASQDAIEAQIFSFLLNFLPSPQNSAE